MRSWADAPSRKPSAPASDGTCTPCGNNSRRRPERPRDPAELGSLYDRGKRMAIIANDTKRKLRAGGLALGFGVHHLRTAATPMIAAAAGHDWLFIDTEHGAFSVHEATQLCLTALPTGVTPIVRVCATALDEGTRALDNGAQGIVVPHVDTVEDARRVAQAFRYPPRGSRSWGGPAAMFRFEPPGNPEAQAAINDEVLVVAMIESAEA